MTQEHPITSPPELIAKWVASMCGYYEAARWGADQELKACCELLDINGCPGQWIDMLRSARRPKPPSLKEQALKTVAEMSDCMGAGFIPKRSDLDIIRRALEALPD